MSSSADEFAKTIGVSLLCACVINLTGCGGLPTIPVVPEADASFRPVDGMDTTGMPDDVAQPLSLRPGDVVTLRLDSAQTVNVEGLMVDARGVLHVPLAGDVPVAGMDLTSAERAVEQALRLYDQSVRATLVLTEPTGQQATVLGAVATPGRYAVIPGTRVADLIASAGGIATVDQEDIAVPAGDLSAARLVRDGEALPVDISRAVEGDQRHNVHVRAGDHLYIPPFFDSLVSVIGEVSSAGAFPYRPGLRLTRALAFAGGPTTDADRNDIVVVRGDHASPQVYQAHLDDLLQGDAPDPVLAPGDVVYVAPSRLARTRDIMTVLSPIISLGLTIGLSVALIRGDGGGGGGAGVGVGP